MYLDILNDNYLPVHIINHGMHLSISSCQSVVGNIYSRKAQNFGSCFTTIVLHINIFILADIHTV